MWLKSRFDDYTNDKLLAYRYSLEDAVSICMDANKYLPPNSIPSELMEPEYHDYST
jgi:hypothetical protein